MKTKTDEIKANGVVIGKHTITYHEAHVIDCGHVPEEGCTGEDRFSFFCRQPEHYYGVFEWDPEKVALQWPSSQKEYRPELAGKKPFPSSMISYLVMFPELIPEGWRAYGKIQAIGTRYGSRREQYTASLHWHDGSNGYWGEGASQICYDYQKCNCGYWRYPYLVAL